MTSPVRYARRGEAALLTSVLTDAFCDDPVFEWLIPPRLPGRSQRLRTFFAGVTRGYLRQGKPCQLAGGDAAAAMWTAPGRSWSSHLLLEAAASVLAFRGDLKQAARFEAQVEALHPAGPHWYLGYLGARRDRRGQGLGSQLLRDTLIRADAAGVPAYLESSNERNLTLYQRHGFQITGELRALGHGPMIWRMWREPQPSR